MEFLVLVLGGLSVLISIVVVLVYIHIDNNTLDSFSSTAGYALDWEFADVLAS